MQVTGPARTRLTIFDFGYLVNIFLVDVNLQCVVSRKTRAAHLSDTRKSHNGHTRLDTKVLEGMRSLNLHFILNWNGKGTRTEREGNANGTGREHELERFKNVFSAAFSVRFLLSSTVAHFSLQQWKKYKICRMQDRKHAQLVGFYYPGYPRLC